jgi:hypothetical protein
LLANGTSTNLPDAASRKAFITRNCIGCHNQKLNTAGLSLQGLDFADVSSHGMIWEKVLTRIHTGQMPPAPLPKPDPALTAAFTTWLERSLDDVSIKKPNPGRPAIHRLNRAEYSNAIRDLLAVDTDPGATLPVDDSGYGFDNIGDVLSMSPVLLERYMSTARRVSRLAVGDLRAKPTIEKFDVPREVRRKSATGPRNERVSDDLPFDSRGGMAFEYYFPLDGEYAFRIKTNPDTSNGDSPDPYEFRVSVKAGLRNVGVSFPRESAKPERTAPPNARRAAAAADTKPALRPPVSMDLRLDGARIQRFEVAQHNTVNVSSVTVAGPYDVAGRGETPSRSKVFICHPKNAADERPCAEKILATLARRAFRRPVTVTDTRPLLAFYDEGRRDGDFGSGIQKAIQAMLMSPDFLFRVEHDPPGTAPGQAYRINNYELASRLSFFLWSSIPDDTLLDLADQGRLQDDAVLEQQVRRMLDDPRSDALATNFGGQWLHLRNLATVTPDPDEFEEFDDELRRSFEKETQLFFESVIREDRGLLSLLNADYTYLNERLAEHYGIPGVYGSQFRRVSLADPNRGGLLGQGSILTVTSYPNRTSVVQRGKWVLENLLGAPPPPPPPDIPDLNPHGKDGQKLSMRQQMEEHRANPTCASCHARMDPIGFALENYNGVGKWRTEDSGSEIDASGQMPDGSVFKGPAGLKKLLLTAHKDEFVDTVTEKLLTYALGRGVEYSDRPAIRIITREAAKSDYRMSALITGIVKSVPFRMRRSLDQ